MRHVLKALALVVLLAGPMAAEAVLLTVDGTQWEVSSVITTFDDDQSLLLSQPWWGNSDTARHFAEAWGVSAPLKFSPLFAYSIDDPQATRPSVLSYGWYRPSGVEAYRGFKDSLFPYATATRVASVPEPGTLALLGLGLAGLGFVRRRKLN